MNRVLDTTCELPFLGASVWPVRLAGCPGSAYVIQRQTDTAAPEALADFFADIRMVRSLRVATELLREARAEAVGVAW